MSRLVRSGILGICTALNVMTCFLVCQPICWRHRGLECLKTCLIGDKCAGMHCIPSHLPDKDPSKVYQKSSDSHMFHMGHWVECIQDINIFTLALFVFFRSQVAITTDHKTILYKGGISVAHTVESNILVKHPVEQTKYDRAIDMIVQFHKDGRILESQFVQEVDDILVQVLEEKAQKPWPDDISCMLLIWKTVNQNHLGFQKRSSLGSVRVYEGNRVIGSIKELMAVSLQQKSRMQGLVQRFHLLNGGRVLIQWDWGRLTV